MNQYEELKARIIFLEVSMKDAVEVLKMQQ